jgi:hypothetical protein
MRFGVSVGFGLLAGCAVLRKQCCRSLWFTVEHWFLAAFELKLVSQDFLTKKHLSVLSWLLFVLQFIKVSLKVWVILLLLLAITGLCFVTPVKANGFPYLPEPLPVNS